MCPEGYYLKNGECVECIGCEYRCVDNVGCMKCKEEYHHTKENKCVSCTNQTFYNFDKEECQDCGYCNGTCSDGTGCDKCMDYYNNKDGTCESLLLK